MIEGVDGTTGNSIFEQNDFFAVFFREKNSLHFGIKIKCFAYFFPSGNIDMDLSGFVISEHKPSMPDLPDSLAETVDNSYL